MSPNSAFTPAYQASRQRAEVPHGVGNETADVGQPRDRRQQGLDFGAVLWIVMVLSPTPGSAGVAELGFSWLFRDFVPAGVALGLAILWRLISYYPYLIIGVPVMTRWVKRVYGSDVRQPRIGID